MRLRKNVFLAVSVALSAVMLAYLIFVMFFTPSEQAWVHISHWAMLVVYGIYAQRHANLVLDSVGAFGTYL